MKLLMVFRALEIATAAAFSHGIIQNEGFQRWGRFMRRSKITLDDFSLVASRCTNALNHCGNRVAPTHASKWQSNFVSAHRTNGRKSTCGLRVFSEVYRVRGFLLALGALHRDRIKLHVDTPNVKVTGAAHKGQQPKRCGLSSRQTTERLWAQRPC